jgi:hypothetical protein
VEAAMPTSTGSAVQNITLALPKETLRRVKIAAAQRGTSISRLVTEALEDIAARDAAYDRAKRRQLSALRRPPNLGTKGRAAWNRDSLHER